MRHFVGLIVALTAFGCSTMSVNTYSSPPADFSALKTYAWAPAPEKSGDARIDENPEFDKTVRDDIDAKLAERGFVKDTSRNPNFWISYYATLNKRVSVQTLDQRSGYNPHYSVDYGMQIAQNDPGDAAGRKYVDSFDEGTLIIDVVDPKTKQLLWRGTAQDSVNFKASPEHKHRKLKEAIDKMLSRFPPKK